MADSLYAIKRWPNMRDPGATASARSSTPYGSRALGNPAWEGTKEKTAIDVARQLLDNTSLSRNSSLDLLPN